MQLIQCARALSRSQLIRHSPEKEESETDVLLLLLFLSSLFFSISVSDGRRSTTETWDKNKKIVFSPFANSLHLGFLLSFVRSPVLMTTTPNDMVRLSLLHIDIYCVRELLFDCTTVTHVH